MDSRRGGGVAVYAKLGTPCLHQIQLIHDNLEVIWLLCRQSSMPREVTHLLIGSVYYPPKANNFEMSEYLISTMDIITRSHPNTGI